MQLVGCQFDLVWENPEENHAKVNTLLETVALPKGSLVALPEMFATGFTMNTEMAEPDPSPSEDFLSSLAKKHKVYFLGGIARRAESGAVRNQSIVFSPDGGVVSRYTKIQGFSPAGESEAFAAGDDIALFDWGGFRVAQFVCYDLRFPELFRAAMKMGANVFVVIASWPVARSHHWTNLLRARAIENQAYVLGVNRCGSDPHFEFAGASEIFDYSGQSLAVVGNREGVISSAVDLGALAEYRERLPFLKDIRDEFVAVPNGAPG